METYTDNYGDEWITCGVLDAGKNSSGAVGAANIRFLECCGNIREVPSYDMDIIHNSNKILFTSPDVGNFSVITEDCYMGRGKTAYIRLTGEQADPELIKKTFDLERYPAYDDVLVSEIETEWEMDAWNNWLYSELMYYLGDKLITYLETQFWPQATIKERKYHIRLEQFYFEMYRSAMKLTNTKIAFSDSELDIDIFNIWQMFRIIIKEHIRAVNYTRKTAWRKHWLVLPGFKAA